MERTKNHLIMMSGCGHQQVENRKQGVSATFQKVPRDKDTVSISELTRVQPMIFKNGLIHQDTEITPLLATSRSMQSLLLPLARSEEVKPCKLNRYVKNFRLIESLRQKLELNADDRREQIRVTQAFVKLYLQE
jgi:hypothetical protein